MSESDEEAKVEVGKVGRSDSQKKVSKKKSSGSPDRDRVRMVVDPASGMEEGLPSRWVKSGSFVEASEKKDFDAKAIRKNVVPDDVGSNVGLDDDESRHSVSSRSLRKGESQRGSKNPDHSGEAEGVLFSKNDLENYDKYHRTTSRTKKTFVGAASLSAVGLTSGTAYVLGGKVMSANNQRTPDQSGFTDLNQKGETKEKDSWWSKPNNEDVPFVFEEGDAKDGELEYEEAPSMPAQNGGSPRELSSLAPLSEEYDYNIDRPFLWMIPRTFGLQVRDAIGFCYKHKFSRQYKGEETDSVFSHLLYKVANSFNLNEPTRRGRMFAMFREPMIRTVDMWHSHRNDPDPDHPNQKNITLLEYLETHNENNWMVRFLANDFEGSITEENLETAKTVLREKCIVGLDTQKEESLQRFISYFKWDTLNLETQHCLNTVMNAPGYEDEVQYPAEGSAEYELLMKRNAADELLYDYIQELYQQQGETGLFEAF